MSSTPGRIVLSSRKSNGDWTLREQNNFSTEGKAAKGEQSSFSLWKKEFVGFLLFKYTTCRSYFLLLSLREENKKKSLTVNSKPLKHTLRIELLSCLKPEGSFTKIYCILIALLVALSGQLILAVYNSSIQLAQGFQHLSRLPPPGFPWPCCCQNTPHSKANPTKHKVAARGCWQHNPLAQEWSILPQPVRVSGLHVFISSLTDKITSPGQSEAGAWSISCWDTAEVGCLDFILCPGLSKAPCPHTST